MGILTTLLQRLKEGEVTFDYRTVDGKIRRARGTLNKERIPREDWMSVKQPKKVENEIQARQQSYLSYYDLGVGEWRRFKIFAVLRIVSFKTMTNVKQERKGFKDIEDDDF